MDTRFGANIIFKGNLTFNIFFGKIPCALRMVKNFVFISFRYIYVRNCYNFISFILGSLTVHIHDCGFKKFISTIETTQLKVV